MHRFDERITNELGSPSDHNQIDEHVKILLKSELARIPSPKIGIRGQVLSKTPSMALLSFLQQPTRRILSASQLENIQNQIETSQSKMKSEIRQTSLKSTHHSSGSAINLPLSAQFAQSGLERDFRSGGNLWSDFDPNQNLHEKELRIAQQNKGLLSSNEKKNSSPRSELSHTVLTLPSAITSKPKNKIDEPNSVRSEEFQKDLEQVIPKSFTRESLHGLKNFVARNCYHKVINSWGYIEKRFEKSSLTKSTTIKDEFGLRQTIKNAALSLSDLTACISSSRVRIKPTELPFIYAKLMVTPDQIFHSRKVAAHKFVVASAQESRDLDDHSLSPSAKFYLAQVEPDLHQLLKVEEPLITLDELRDAVFSQDKEERRQELGKIGHSSKLSKDRDMQLIEEKRRKDELAAKMEARKAKMRIDFHETLIFLQYPKGALSRYRHYQLCSALNFCVQLAMKMSLSKTNVIISDDLVALLGLDAFPPIVQETKSREYASKAASEARTIRPRDNVNLEKSTTELLSPEEYAMQLELDSSYSEDIKDKIDVARSSWMKLVGEEAETVDLSDMDGDFLYRLITSMGNLYSEEKHGMKLRRLARIGKKLHVNTFIDWYITSTFCNHTRKTFDHSDDDHLFHPSSNTQVSEALIEHDRVIKEQLEKARVEPSDYFDVSILMSGIESDPAAKASKVGFNGKFRVRLQGKKHGTVLDLIKETVGFGKGLNGMAFREVAEVLQAYAATRIQAFCRGYCRGWRYSAARKKWKVLFKKSKHDHFFAWKRLVSDLFQIRLHCWRKIKVWRKYTTMNIKRRDLFRCTFWPLHVWRRYVHASLMAKEKTKFLVSRVMPTSLQLKVFKAWRDYSAVETKIRKTGEYCYIRKQKSKMLIMLRWLSRWTSRRKGLRRAWAREGAFRYHKFLRSMVNNPFQIWKMTVYFRKLVRSHIRLYSIPFRKVLLGKMPLVPAPNRTQNRYKIALDRERKLQEETERVRKIEAERLRLTERSKKEALNGKKSPPSPPSPFFASLNKRKPKREELTVADQITIRLNRLYHSEGPPFPWKFTKEDIDLHSDSDEEEVIPPTIALTHESIIPPLTQLAELYSLRNTEPKLLNILQEMKDKYLVIDIWSIYEGSVRFHRLSKRVIQNFRIHAKVRKNARTSQYKRQIDLKRKIFNALLGWMCRDPLYTTGSNAEQTEAEKISTRLREARLLKFKRRRLAALEVKEAIGRAYDDPPMIEEEAIKSNSRYKNRRAILRAHRRHSNMASNSPSQQSKNKSQGVSELTILEGDEESENENEDYDTDRSNPENSKLKKVQEKKEIGSLMRSIINDSKTNNFTFSTSSDSVAGKAYFEKLGIPPPDFLSWDREEREREMKIVEEMSTLSQNLQLKSYALARDAGIISHMAEAQQSRREAMFKEVLETEEKFTEKAIANEFEFIKDFKVHAVSVLIDSLVKVHDQIREKILKERTKIYFRALRMPMLLKRSIIIRNRKKISNWIRLCRRLISVDKLAPRYYYFRKMWVVYNRWLKLLEKQTIDCSPGLITFLKRKGEHFRSFNDSLIHIGFSKAVRFAGSLLKNHVVSLGSILNRWKMYVQEKIVFIRMEKIAEKLYRLRLLRQCFESIRTSMNHEFTYPTRSNHLPFQIIRVLEDLDQISRRFIAKRKIALANVIRVTNKKHVHSIKMKAREEMTFRRLIDDLEEEITARINCEMQLLTEYYQKRGRQEVMDIMGLSANDPRLPRMMTKLEGKKFTDPLAPIRMHIAEKSDRPQTSQNTFSKSNITHDQSSTNTINIPIDESCTSIPLPGGYLISKIRLNFQNNGGSDWVVGWQLVWSADGVPDILSPKRGRWDGAAMILKEISVPKGDYLMAIEYFYEGSSILGMRIKCYFEGWSKWVGSRSSLSTLTLVLSAEIAPKEDFEDEYVPAGKDEANNPAMPRRFIIGFSGIESSDLRATCLGIVVRLVKDQNIFSYHWIKDALSKELGETTLNTADGVIPGDPLLDDGEEQALLPIIPSSVEENLTLPPIKGGKSEIPQPMNGINGPTVKIETEPPQSPSQSMNGQSGEATQENHPYYNFAHDFVKGQKRIDNASEMLTPSESQFFDVMRMRASEIKAARVRVINFARGVWTGSTFFRDSNLFKLSNIRILRPLCRWLFCGLSKRLMSLCTTESEGMELIIESHKIGIRAEVMQNRSVGTYESAKNLEQTVHPWTGVSLLSPELRKAKGEFKHKIKMMYEDAKLFLLESRNLKIESIEKKKKGTSLLPRLQLSIFVVNNYRLKIAAARHKESLLERMDLDTLKSALSGSTSGGTMLSHDAMEAVHKSLGRAKHAVPQEIPREDTLEYVVQKELELFQEQRLQEQQRAKAIARANRQRKTEIRAQSRSAFSNSTQNLRKEFQNPSPPVTPDWTRKFLTPLNLPSAGNFNINDSSGRKGSFSDLPSPQHPSSPLLPIQMRGESPLSSKSKGKKAAKKDIPLPILNSTSTSSLLPIESKISKLKTQTN